MHAGGFGEDGGGEIKSSVLTLILRSKIVVWTFSLAPMTVRGFLFGETFQSSSIFENILSFIISNLEIQGKS